MYDVLVARGGLAGSALAVHLLNAPGNRSTVLFEREERIGRGPAYGTSDLALRLNVPAGNMSLYAHRPLDFVTWLA